MCANKDQQLKKIVQECVLNYLSDQVRHAGNTFDIDVCVGLFVLIVGYCVSLL